MDVSSDVMLIVAPTFNKTKTPKFKLQYIIRGIQYEWIETLFLGPNGETYYIVAVTFASLIGALLLAALIFVIVKCCRVWHSE